MRRWILSAACLLGLAVPAAAATLVVPSEPYPTIQSAVNAAGTGDTVLVLAGTYPEFVTITGKTGLRLLGKGGPVIAPVGNDGIEVTGCTDLEISGFTVQGVGNGIYAFNTTDLRIRKVALAQVEHEALGLVNCDGVLVSRCSFSAVEGKGVEDSSSTGLVIDRCTFEDCAEGAIVLSPLAAAGSASEGARILRCVVTGPSPGLKAGGAGLLIDRNRFEVAGGAAIDLETTARADGAVVSRNTIAMTGTDRSVLLAGTGIRCLKNRITGGGIIESGAQNTLEKNSVAAADFGIAVNGSAATVRGNRIQDVDGIGLDLSSSGHTIEKNVVARCSNAGIYGSVSNTDFLSNRVADAPYGIIVVYGGNTFTGNRVTGTTNIDLWDQEDATNQYGKNAFRTSLFGPGS